MIAKGGTCPECRWSEKGEAGGNGEATEAFIEEYERRKAEHTKNYTIFMTLMFGFGLIGLLIAWMWIMAIYRGNVLAMIMLIPLHIILGVLGFMIKMSKRMFPTDINCPNCDLRVDELGLDAGCCPGCKAQLAQ
jgi:hypothetical protein